MCRSVPDAEDAVQAALERAWRNRASLRDPDRLKPWLDRIVVREAIRITRSREGLVGRLLRGSDDEIELELELVDPRASEGARGVELRQAFARLSAEQRAVVALHLYAGYSVAETADIVGAPLETARSRLRLARQRLRIELETRDHARHARIRRRGSPRLLAVRADLVATRAVRGDEMAVRIAERIGVLPRRRGSRMRLMRLAVMVALLLIALAVAALYFAGRERSYAPESPQVTSVVHGAPWAVALSHGSVWVGAYRSHSLPDGPGNGGDPFRDSDRAPGLRPDRDRVRVSLVQRLRRVLAVRLDPSTLHIDRLTGYGTDRVTFGGGSVWIPHDGALERLDPITLATIDRFPDSGAGLLAYEGGALWLSDADGGLVRRIDVASGEIEPITWDIPTGRRYPVHIAAAGGSVWVVDEQQLRVYRIDPATNVCARSRLTWSSSTEPASGTTQSRWQAGAVGPGVGDGAGPDRFATGEEAERVTTEAAGGGAFAITEDAIWVANLKTRHGDRRATSVTRRSGIVLAAIALVACAPGPLDPASPSPAAGGNRLQADRGTGRARARRAGHGLRVRTRPDRRAQGRGTPVARMTLAEPERPALRSDIRGVFMLPLVAERGGHRERGVRGHGRRLHGADQQRSDRGDVRPGLPDSQVGEHRRRACRRL